MLQKDLFEMQKFCGMAAEEIQTIQKVLSCKPYEPWLSIHPISKRLGLS